MASLKIFHIITRLLRAGSEENTIFSCLGQVAAGHDVTIVHGVDYDDRNYEKYGKQIKFIRINSLVHPLSPKSDLKAYIEMRALFQKMKPDIVHTHQSKAGIIGRFSAKSAGVPCILHGVHIVPFVNVGPVQKAVYLSAEHVAGWMTNAFVDVSRGVRDIYLAHHIGAPEHHHIVRSGFDLSKFRAAPWPDDWREVLNIGPDQDKPPVIMMLAALEPRKRHSEFLDHVGEIFSRLPDARIILPGEGPVQEQVAAKIAAAGLQDRVRLLGYRTDPERLIALSDICTLTSTREGLPRVVMQYLTGGKPCVATDLPGLDEVLADGVNGVVKGPDDFAGVARALADILCAPAELERLSEGARQTDLSSWQVETMCSDLERICQAYAPAGRRDLH